MANLQVQNRQTLPKPEYVKSAQPGTQPTAPTAPSVTTGNPTMDWIAKWGLMGGGTGLGLAAIRELSMPRFKPYDPKSVLQRLGGVSAVTPSGPDIDVMYPVIKKKAQEAPLLPNKPPGMSGFAAGAWALPAFAGSGLLGYAGLSSYFDNKPKVNPYANKYKDTEFLKQELAKQKFTYRNLLLSRQADRAAANYKMSTDNSLAVALDNLATKMEKSGWFFPLLARLGIGGAGASATSKAFTDTWNPIKGVERVNEGINQGSNHMRGIAGLGLGALAVGAPLAAMYGFSGEKERLNKENPIPKTTDVDKNVVQAIKLRSRALTQARGLPPINLRAVPVEADEPTFKRSSDLSSEKLDGFVDTLFGD